MRRLPQRFVILSFAIILLTCCTLLVSKPSGEPPGLPTVTAPTSTQSAVGQPTQPLVDVPTIPPLPTAVIATPSPLEPALTSFPQGDLIYAASGKGMVRIQPGQQEAQRLLDLPSTATYPFLSPGGKRLGFIFHQDLPDGIAHLIGVQEGSHVYLPSAKSPARSLTSEPFLAAWSPDGNMAVSVSALGSEDHFASYYVQVSAFDAQAPPVYWNAWTNFQVKDLDDLIWSPDGRALVFIAAGQGGQRFFMAKLGQAPLEINQEQQFETPLPQETALALQALPGGRLLYATNAGIYLQSSPVDHPRLVTNNLAPYVSVTFNASGRWAAIYTKAQGGPFILDLLTGNERQLGDTQPGSFSEIMLWSPDGGYLAFSLPDELALDLDDLYVTSPAGPVTFLRTITRLSPDSGVQNLLEWHPSQPYLSFLERYGYGYLIWLAAADGSGYAYLNPGALVEDAHFAWQAPASTLEVVNLPLAPEPCVALAPRLKIGNSALSSQDPPVVSLLYSDATFESSVVGSLNPGEQAWVLSGPVCIKDSNFWLLQSKSTNLVGWAAEGASEYFIVPRSDALLFTIKHKIYALPLDVPELRLVADPERHAPGIDMQFISPNWLPDGQSFSYLATAPDIAAGLYIQPYPDGAVVDLLSSLAQTSYDLPAGVWSPDGSRLVVSLGPKDGNRDLYLIHADGSLVQNLTGSPELDDRSPAWSPDGTRIVYLSGKDEDTEIYVLIPGESIDRLTNNQVEEMSPAWSPLGNRIVYAEMTNKKPELYMISSLGTDRARLSTEPGWYPAWSPDGLRIAFTDPLNDRLLLMNTNGSNLRVLALAGDDRYPVQVVWAPSGGHLAYVYQKTLYIYDLSTSMNVPMAAGLDNPWIAWQP